MHKKLAIIFGVCLALVQSVRADQTTVNMDSGLSGIHLVADQNTAANNPLTSGTALDGDGAIIQLGYFTGATAANSFLGTWVALSGQGSANTGPVPNSAELMNQTSIGDTAFAGPGPGQFAITLNFDPANPLSNNNLPAAGTILSIRFYNGTTLGNSSFFNTVSNDSWTWVAPATPSSVVNLSLDEANLEWESIVKFGQAANTAFHTTIAIPEPSTYALLVFGAASMVALRRRVKR